MILAAGLGTRLLPLTEKKPKPLFPIVGRPLLDILICNLQDSGCEAIMINTHHLAEMIDDFIKSQRYNIPVILRYESTILGTGGAIKNVEDFWDKKPFMVINGDLFTNIDLKSVYSFHLNHKYPATMVLHDYSKFNNVWLNSRDFITGFGPTDPPPPLSHRQLAFTGIQVIDPQVLEFIPTQTFYSIIDAYRKMIQKDHQVHAYITSSHYWHDIGTLEGYQEAATEAVARKILSGTGPKSTNETLLCSKLKGDGSDRAWHRVSKENRPVILVNHGPAPEDSTCEADSFFAIGRHLEQKGIPVPHIFHFDRPSGVIAMEDLGDLHLQTIACKIKDEKKLLSVYKTVLDILLFMAIEASKDFNPSFTYQTPYFDREVILEKECTYFLDAFLDGYKRVKIDSERFKEDFELLAERALASSYTGFLHRDFQSRNILVDRDKYYIIDFQAARLGPLQYDLASLLIDPYVRLASSTQEKLLMYYVERLSDSVPVNEAEFIYSYKYCAISRNLQILGAFGFLSKVKGKKDFEAYIPAAINSLKRNLDMIEPQVCPQLRNIVKEL